MIGRRTYTRAEVAHARLAVADQLAAYARLADAVAHADDPRAVTSLASFETHYFNDAVLVLDGFFRHRTRPRDAASYALDRVERLAEALSHDHLVSGEPVRLDAGEYALLAAAFIDEIEACYGVAP